MKVYLNNKFIDEEKATINIKDRGLLLGDSIFDTLLGETLEKSLETKITIDKNLYQINKIEISGQASKYDDPKIIRKLTISNFDKPFDISIPSLK